MTILPNMLLVLPTVGSDIGTWGTKLNTLFSLVDAHDHTGGKGVLIRTAAISIDADLSLVAHGLTSIGRLAMRGVTALTSGVTSIFCNIADNELYWRTAAGANVKLTNGASINTTLVGGIVGDYSTVGAEVAYDDANDRYTFKQQTTKPWAKIACGDLQIFETGTTEAVSVRIKCPAALAASFDITLPLAVPGSDALVQMTTAGVLSASNTIANAVTLSGGIANNVTLTLGATAAANQNLVVSGTGRHKHGSREINFHISAFKTDIGGLPTGATGWTGTNAASDSYNQSGFITGFQAAAVVSCPVPLEVGKRILTYTQYYNVNGTGASITPNLKRMNLSTGVVNTVSAGAADNTGAALESQTLSSINHTVLTGEAYFIEVTVTNTGHRVHGATITYDD